MKEDFKVALVITRAFNVAQENGIFALRKFEYEYEEIKKLWDIAFDCLNKNLEMERIYEILQNYGEDIKNKKIHKIIVNGFMCIIDGQSVEYFMELIASILGLQYRNQYIEEAEKILKKKCLTEQVYEKYTKKETFSEKIDFSKELFDNVEKLKKALYSMNNKEVKVILSSVSGEYADQLINLIDINELKYIDEEVIEDLDEKNIMDIKKKFINFLDNND